MEQQQRQHLAPAARTEVDGAAIRAHLQRAEDQVLHPLLGATLPDGGHGVTGTGECSAQSTAWGGRGAKESR